MKKCANIYERKGQVFVRTSSETQAGMRIEVGPCRVLAASVTPELIGEAVLGAMEASESGLPQPARDGWKEVPRPLLEAAGVRSYATFGKSAKFVSAVMSDQVALTPSESDGLGGFMPLREEAASLPLSATRSEVGAAVLAVLAKCKSHRS